MTPVRSLEFIHQKRIEVFTYTWRCPQDMVEIISDPMPQPGLLL
jgi:hypothetical protein